jgi:hypothetical protein
MPLIRCPDCRRKVSDTAPSCPRCGRPAPLISPEIEAKREESRRVWTRVLLFFVVLIGLLAVLGEFAKKEVTVYGPDGIQRFTRYGDGPDEIRAFVDCNRFVEASLRAPSTAKFADYSPDRVQAIGASRFRVRSWVDAENGFGARLRGRYTCTVRYDGETPVIEDLIGPQAAAALAGRSFQA